MSTVEERTVLGGETTVDNPFCAAARDCWTSATHGELSTSFDCATASGASLVAKGDEALLTASVDCCVNSKRCHERILSQLSAKESGIGLIRGGLQEFASVLVEESDQRRQLETYLEEI